MWMSSRRRKREVCLSVRILAGNEMASWHPPTRSRRGVEQRLNLQSIVGFNWKRQGALIGSQSYGSEITDSGIRDHISGQRPGVPASKKRWRSLTINGIFLLLMLEATLSRMSRPSLVGILWSGVFTVCAPGNLLASKLHRWLSCHLGKPWGL